MLVPHGAHVMVVDGARRALFRNKGKDFAPALDLIEEAEAHVPATAALGSDRPGRAFQSMGSERGAYETTDLHQLAEDDFAADAAARIEGLLQDNDAAVLLVAAPHTLGEIRKQLAPKQRARLLAEIDKDYAGRTAQEIAAMLAQHGS